MTERPRALGRTALAVAAGCWSVSTALLLVAPLLAKAAGDAVVEVAAPFSTGWWTCLATLAVQASLLLLVPAAPRRVLVAVAAVTPPLALAHPGDLFTLTSTAVAVAVFCAGLRSPLPQLRLPAAVAALLVAAGQLLSLQAAAGGRLQGWSLLVPAVLQGVAVVGLPLLLVSAIVGQRDARRARTDELVALQREHRALVRAAVADERTAMARELHDIAAHHLTGIALVAAAIDHQVDADPAAAKESARQIRTQSTAVLGDLRRLVGLLREDDDASRSVHTLSTVTELVEQRRAAGTPVEQVVDRAPGRLELGAGVGPLAQLGLYRIAQEALTNAAVHAPGAATALRIDDRRDDVVVVTVTNARPEGGAVPGRSGSGFGLVGMAERADLIGATLHHGPTADGGWEVVVSAPREQPEGIGGASGTPVEAGRSGASGAPVARPVWSAS